MTFFLNEWARELQALKTRESPSSALAKSAELIKFLL